jgi:Zn ribbon nucleic-acid-binding protein
MVDVLKLVDCVVCGAEEQEFNRRWEKNEAQPSGLK